MRSLQSFTPCAVTTYSGRHGDERPSSLVFDGREIAVLSLYTTRIEEDVHSRERKRFFAALGSDGAEYLLCLSEADGTWSARMVR